MDRVIFLGGFLFSIFCAAASYEVPAPTELQSANKWPEISAQASLVGNEFTAKYSLPVDLVGTEVKPIELSGTLKSKFIEVSGDGVYGICMRYGTALVTCMLRYPELNIDEKSRDEALSRTYQGQELDLRRRMARVFSNDPAGVLTVEVN